jgi:NAD+ synthase
MAIVNAQATVEAISTWIRQRIDIAGAKTAVVGVSGGADSALVAILCKMKVLTVGVIMPCHSSPDSVKRANELCNAFEIPSITVPLDDAFKSISTTAVSGLASLTHAHVLVDHPAGNLDNGALRSCLRAPTLDYVSKLTKGLIVGTGNRDEDEMTRYFQKRGDGCVDISPIAKLHKSETYELLRYLKAPQSIIDAVPSADLWGADSGQADEKELGLTYAEVEWGVQELQDRPYSKALQDFQDGRESHLPGRGVFIDAVNMAYSKRQKEILRTLADMENKSRHKAEPPPVFDVRAVFGLVR